MSYLIDEHFPVGKAFVFFTSGTIPSNWAECNGNNNTLNKNVFPELWNAIGTTYGSNDPYIVLPDHRGYFHKGTYSGVSWQVGITDVDKIPLHVHNSSLAPWYHWQNSDPGLGYLAGGASYFVDITWQNSAPWGVGILFDDGIAADSYSGTMEQYFPNAGVTQRNYGLETRPENVALICCIRIC